MTGVEQIEIAGRWIEVQHLTVPHPAHTIVLLHEALGSVSHWREFPRLLSERCRVNVLLYSRTGHGWSEGPPQQRSRVYYYQQALGLLPTVLERFKVERPVLFGHSEGAAIAVLYAAAHPEDVRALVLESPIVRAEPASAVGMAMAERAWRETDLRERLARHHRDPDAVFEAWLSIRDSDALLAMPLEDHLWQIECPVLMVQGERDEYATRLQAEALAPLAPGMQLVRLPESGHTPHREQPERMLELIAGFLSGLSADPLRRPETT